MDRITNFLIITIIGDFIKCIKHQTLRYIVLFTCLNLIKCYRYTSGYNVNMEKKVLFTYFKMFFPLHFRICVIAHDKDNGLIQCWFENVKCFSLDILNTTTIHPSCLSKSHFNTDEKTGQQNRLSYVNL